MNEFEKISKEMWVMSFDNWVGKIEDIETYKEAPFIGSGECGYCEFYGADWDSGEREFNCECPLKGKICGTDDSFVDKLIEAEDGAESVPELIKTARQILQAIVDDGRKHGYIGKKEEKIINEVMNDGK